MTVHIGDVDIGKKLFKNGCLILDQICKRLFPHLVKQYVDSGAIQNFHSVLPVRRKKSRKPQRMEIPPPTSLGNILQPISEGTEVLTVSDLSDRTKLELELTFRKSEMKLIRVFLSCSAF